MCRVGITFGKNIEYLLFHEVSIYQYINEVIKYWTPNINKSIVNLRKLIAYLESTFMKYHGFQISKHLHIFSRDIGNSIAVPLYARVADTHIERGIDCNLAGNTIFHYK